MRRGNSILTNVFETFTEINYTQLTLRTCALNKRTKQYNEDYFIENCKASEILKKQNL